MPLQPSEPRIIQNDKKHHTTYLLQGRSKNVWQKEKSKKENRIIRG